MCDAAIDEFRRNDEFARFVNYVNLPDLMWESILPNHFNVDEVDLDNMKLVATKYSKGRGDMAGKEWKDDSKYKQDRANSDIRSAAQSFLQERYETMEQLSLENTQ